MSFAKHRLRQIRPKAFRAVVIGTVAIGLDVALTAHCPALAAGAYAVTIPRGGPTAVELAAPPNARCVLGPMNSPSSQRLTAISDARGIARYYVSVNGTAQTGVLAVLECTGSKAHTLVGVTLTPGAPAPRTAPVTTSRPLTIGDLTTTARFGVLPGTPAGFDVTTASAAQLAQLHYPPRPDPKSNPMAYAMWRKAMTTPGIYAPAVPVPIPSGPTRVFSRARLPAANAHGGKLKPQNVFSTDEPDSWQCGSELLQFVSPFLGISAMWYVPQVIPASYGLSTSSTTLALNGISTGTEQDSVYWPNFGLFSSYYAWSQTDSTTWGQPPARYAYGNSPIAPGDAVAFGAAPYYGIGYFVFTDYTTNEWTYAEGSTPAYPGYGAEWVEERTNSQLPLAGFGSVTMSYAQASIGDALGYFEPDGTSLNPSYNSYQYLLQMTSNGSSSGDLMCNPSFVGTAGNVGIGLQFAAPF